MKKRLGLIVFTMFLLLLSGGCGDGQKDSGTLKVVCTSFPQYDWVKNIIGGGNTSIELKLMADNGVDIHSYQPSAADIARISACDVLIRIGGTSEEWIDEVLAGAVNKDMKVISLMEVLADRLKGEEVVPGMQEEEHNHEEASEYDEHLWLSLRNAGQACAAIRDVLSDMDEQNREQYQKNTEEYIQKLEMLDEEYKTMIEGAERDTLLFGDRFPFRYLVEDYGLQYYAAFPGCLAETEASFDTIAFLAGRLDEEHIPVVLVIDDSSQGVAQTIVANSRDKNQQILRLDSMQSVARQDIEKGVDYYSVMKDNLEVFWQALH